MIRCWFFRQTIARHMDAAEDLPPRLEEHLAGCLRCREFHALHSRVVSGLQTSAASEMHQSPPFLHAKIMARIRGLDLETTASERPFFSLRWSTASTFAAIALALVLIVQQRLSTRPSSHQIAQGTVPTQTSPGNAVVQPPIQWLVQLSTADRLHEWSRTLEHPLEKELEFVVDDAKTALQLVVHSFLPKEQ